jgi:hypothetical protein
LKQHPITNLTKSLAPKMTSPAMALGDIGELPLELVDLILRNVGEKPGRLTHKQLHDLNALRRTNHATNTFVQDWIIREVKKIKTYPSATAALEALSNAQQKAIEPPGSVKFVSNDALTEAIMENCTTCVDGMCNILGVPGIERPYLCNKQGWPLLCLSLHCAETSRRLLDSGLTEAVEDL